MSRYPFKLSHQFSYVAVVAVGVIVAIAGLNFWEQAKTNALIAQQTELLELKKRLSSLEIDTVKARLDEVQMLNTHDLAWFARFQDRIEQIDVVIEQVIQEPQDLAHIQTDLQQVQKTLERYAKSVERTHKVKQTMGLGKETGTLDQIHSLERPIQDQLKTLHQQDLILQFVSLQLLENEFSTTLNMKLADQLRSQLQQLQQTIPNTAFSVTSQQELLQHLQAYETALSDLLNSTLELELVTAENSLQYDRIAPILNNCQAKIDAQLSHNTRQLNFQKRQSQIRTIAVFTVALLILLLLMSIQLRAAQRLVSRLQQLATQMSAMAQGRFATAQNLPSGSDEVGRLAQTFLKMSGQLQTQMQVIKQEQEKAEIANQAKSEFLARMSHELRTPLNAILGFAQLLHRDQDILPQHRDQVGIIQRSGEHLLNLINDVLDMAKIEAGRMELNPQPFQLDRFVKTIAEMFTLKAQSKGLQLVVDAPESLPNTIEADNGKLRQVLINLLGNAFKFTEQGYVRLAINFVAGAPSQLHCVVEDTGAGIAPNELAQLFEAFTQTETGRKSGQGTGLGLSISRQFVELMGGELTVQSQVGAGTQFEFKIPVEVLDSTVADPHHTPVVAIAPHQPDYRILVAEDKPDNQNLMLQLLGDVGFVVSIANNGEEAVQQWELWQPHFIWMDIQMPIMDGFAATTEIRKREQAQGRERTTIIALTASVLKSDHARIRAVGCDDILGKPFQANELFAKMQTYLGVEYDYETEGEAAIAPTVTPTHENLALQLLEQSTEWVWALHNATLEADSEKILSLLEELPQTHTELATVLTNLVDNFDFETIVQATQASLETTVGFEATVS